VTPGSAPLNRLTDICVKHLFCPIRFRVVFDFVIEAVHANWAVSRFIAALEIFFRLSFVAWGI
jgi:hypothetical protein